ncbi:sensor histidine kinase [Olivibacter sitiensis]|uniref:sensor histidine kinase n=1 Tax=Olivibacter sitiensis TaxID=376470 RepID=UPI0004150A18|nr:sensor histidine kinase [Olivibacter sitiensis]
MIKREHILYHVLVWGLLMALLYFSNGHKTSPGYDLIFFIITIINIATFYASYFLVTPYFIGLKKVLTGLMRLALVLLISISVKFVLALLDFDTVAPPELQISRLQYLGSAFIMSSVYIFAGYAFRLVMNSVKLEQTRKNLENEKLNAELAFLKSQINPHFLFNSLNNIYSLAYQKSDKAPEAILKLSEIMRYMLYESNVEKVALEDEISYLESYIDLQKLRVKEHVYLELTINVDNFQHRVMPMLLISFLENVFKHGITTDEENPIRILVEVQHGRLHFKAQNKKSKLNKDKTGGIGMTNLKRRLELGYPGKHSLSLKENGDYYSSELFVYL